jgi:raffinose/stachyose/melibiose transport system permease protein
MNNTDYLKQKIRNKYKLLILLILPQFIIYSIFVIYPVIRAAFFSLYKWNGIGPLTNFICINNFFTVLKDQFFHTALINNIWIIVVSIATQLPLSFIFAYLLRRKNRINIILRSLIFLPFVLQDIATGIIWRFISQSVYQHIFADTATAFIPILFAIWWKYLGLYMIIFIAGFQNIPVELEEAACIDGANTFQTIRHIIIPQLLNTAYICILFLIINAFQQFDIVMAMTEGGPLHASETVVTYIFNFGFIRFLLGHGSAAAVILFLICFVFNMGYHKLMVEKKE